MLSVRSLSKRYPVERGQAQAGVDQVNVEVPKGSFFTLLGPSGCGKTTTLRCVAGLEQPDAGTIEIGNDIVFDSSRGIELPVNRRDIGMVFQSYAIWPHMTVQENAAFPLTVRRHRRSASEVAKRVHNVLEAVGLHELASRPATQLSGGQQQRLALARAIVHEPSLLLLDEPLSNLDVRLRDEMRIELKRLQQQVGITAIYVTHDQSEALAMSDMIAVMNNGSIVQTGTAHEIYHSPANRFVASFIGTTNFFEGVVTGAATNGAGPAIKVSEWCVLECSRHAASAGSRVVVSVRPEAIELIPRNDGGNDVTPNLIHGVVKTRTFLGNATLYHVETGGRLVQVAGSRIEFDREALVSLKLPADKMVVLAV